MSNSTTTSDISENLETSEVKADETSEAIHSETNMQSSTISVAPQSAVESEAEIRIKFELESMEATEIELSLQDKFVIPQEIVATSEIKSESHQLPNVLVDPELMGEIASIPDRFGFKIGDVADLLGIKQYVLRYWEQEFDLLRPKKASNNQRLYTRRDVENAYLIRKLLYRDKFSIEGARQALKDVKYAVKKEKDLSSVIQKIDTIQDQIRGLVVDIRKVKELFT